MHLLTARAAAAQLGVTYSTFKRWIHRGAVQTTLTDGGHHRVPQDEVDRLLAGQRPAPP
ncbi:MAG: excisionase family DNA-binding protein, partial [Acidobacteriota bacterium]